MTSGQPDFREFVAAVFGPDYDPKTIHIAHFKGDPQVKDEGKWHGHRLSDLTAGYIAAPYADENHFICMGVLDPATVKRSVTLVREHTAFWMDDVGTKVKKEVVDQWIARSGLEPNAVIETSPGNFSYMWGLTSRVKADGGFDDQTVAAIRHQMKVDGWGDPVTQEPSRYMRTGFGVNGKAKYTQEDGSPFKLRFERFQNLTHVSLENFALYMIGKDWRNIVASGSYLTSAQLAAKSGGGSLDRNASMDDPFVKLAAIIGLAPQPTRAGVINAHCPNEADHTGGDPTGFDFINLDGMCFCNHASCQHLNSLDFREMIIKKYDDQMLAGEAFGWLEEDPTSKDKLVDSVTGEVFFRSGRQFIAVEAFRKPGAPSVAEVQAEAEAIAKRHADEQTIMDDVSASKVDALFERYVFVDEADQFWDREKGTLVSSDRLSKDEKVLEVYKYTTGAKKASTQLLNARVKGVPRLKHVDTIVNKPYRADQVPASDLLTIGRQKTRVINAFLPTDIGFRAGVPTDFLAHLDYLFGNQPDVKEYLIEYMAFRLQNPAVKMSVIPVIGGKPGIGKDAQLLQPFFRLLGLHNVSELTASKLASDFNDFLTYPTLYLGEFSLAGRDGEKLYDRLKDFSSPNPVQVTINPKYGKTYKTEVGPCFVATTNNRHSLEHVPTDDRRFFIAWSDVHPKPPSYYEALTASYDPNTPVGLANLEVLHHYLMHLQISRFNPNRAPPRTLARHETLLASLSGVARFVYELVVEGDFSGRKVLSFDEVMDRCVNSDNPTIKSRAHDKSVSDGLKAAGCVPIGRLSVNGKRMRLWTGSCVHFGEDSSSSLGALRADEAKRLAAAKEEAAALYVSETHDVATPENVPSTHDLPGKGLGDGLPFM